MKIEEVAKRYESYVIETRRYLHQYPEESGKEYNTSKFIKAELDKLGVPFRDCGLETGVLATITGGNPGKTVLIRGDMDALSVTEETELEYASRNQGFMHACGHDCHTSMLLTAAHILWDMRDELCGTVKLAFQPAEEIAAGAKSMIDDGALDGVDAAMMIHVMSFVPSHKIYCRPGGTMAGASQFMIEVTGRGGHGSQPEKTIDPVLATANIVTNLQLINSRNVRALDSVVVTVGKMQSGNRFNVIPSYGIIEGSVRYFNKEADIITGESMERIAKNTAQAFGASAEVTYDRIVPACICDSEVTEVLRKSSAKIMGEDALLPLDVDPVMGSEDFGNILNKVPGAVALLGVGCEECDSLWPQHNPKYKVDESVLIKGAMIYAQFAMDYNMLV